jgi:hypothetical protein
MNIWDSYNVEGIYKGNIVRIIGLAGHWGDKYICEREGEEFVVPRKDITFPPKKKS